MLPAAEKNCGTQPARPIPKIVQPTSATQIVGASAAVASPTAPTMAAAWTYVALPTRSTRRSASSRTMVIAAENAPNAHAAVALDAPRLSCRWTCLLYTSDAADDLTRVDLGGRRIIKKKK